MHRYRHIVQTSCEKEFNRKEIKYGTTLIIFFSQYEWTNSLTDVPIEINDIFTLFYYNLKYDKCLNKRSLDRFYFFNH